MSTAAELVDRLAANAAFAAAWARFPDGHRREWSRWVDEAKKADTRARRADLVVEQVLAKT